MAHLNEVNMCLHGENPLSAVFQMITAFKIKLWQDHAMPNNFTHFTTLAKHNPLSNMQPCFRF